MIISVINHTDGAVSDAEMQRVLRAINRQISEDFEPYWSMGAQVRLEGKSTESPDAQDPADLRGDAIIYVWNEADVDEAIGYHELNNRGIPYGFVFKEVADELEEPWSVTLSHEALEMIADPEVNLLVMGPHPEEPERDVFHWYEVCDAVQAERYEIDGVEVSNFVLPLYFTGGEELGGRNDFLGTVNSDGSTLQSFGVNPGAYVGFYDPAVDDHATFDSDEEAARRMRVKRAIGVARRSVRYRVGARRSSGLELEALTFELRATATGRGATDPRRVVGSWLGDGWWLQPLGRREFEALPPAGRPYTVTEAWDLVHAGKERPEIAWVEPEFEIPDPHDLEVEERPARGLRASGGGGGGDPDLAFDWSVQMVRARAAWRKKPGPGGRRRGEGVLVGHPDTGWRRHREIWSDEPGAANRLRADLDYDFIEEDDHAEGPQGKHGLGTASVIMSQEEQPGERGVTGIAPRAELVPLRVARKVVLWRKSNRRLRRAIRRAREVGCHVISMSLGGILRSRSLRNEIRRAVDDDILVLAAAGNGFGILRPPVVYPARYPEVVAVAACNHEGRPWRGSCRGPKVDVTAPGENVWKAAKDGRRDDVVQSSGTSFAVATTAGVAALWLAFHGRDRLRARYGSRLRLTEVFRKVLEGGGCDASPHLPAGKFGAGIVNAWKVLGLRLPPAPRARRARARRRAEESEILEDLLEMFDDMPEEIVRRRLAEHLGATPGDLEDALRDVGDELLFHLLVDPNLRCALRCDLRASTPVRAHRGRRAVAPGGFARALRAHGVSGRLARRIAGEAK